MLRRWLSLGLAALILGACNSSSDGGQGRSGDSAMSCGENLTPGFPRLQREGRWLIDQHRRVVISHGVNLVWKNAPFVPPDTPEGFTAADADWLVEHGFNTVRIGTLWVGVSPDQPGQIDESYLDRWERIIKLLSDRGIWMLFDFHQDMLGPIYQGEGVPEWAILDGPTTSLLGSPSFGFPFNYFTPQVSEAFDNLWKEKGSVWQGYRAAWMAVAERWREQPYSMGYDLLNEPWAGLEWLTCIVLPMAGCPAADRNEIQPFYEYAIAGIRAVDPNNLVWMEPQLLAGGTGSPTGFEPIDGELQLGYSVHNYCPLSALLQAVQLGLLAGLPVSPQDTCDSFEQNVFEQSRVTAERIGAVELVTEFGASDEPELLSRVTATADQHLVGWQYWAYKEWADPTTQSQESGSQGLFTDDANLNSAKQEKLDILERPYPQSTAGEPRELNFDPLTREFNYRYQPWPATANTVIYLPERHYPNGYQLDITGGTGVSSPDAERLEILNNGCSEEVSVRVVPRTL